MKIAYILSTLTNKGGVERIIIDKANALAERQGIEVYIVCAAGHDNDVPGFNVDSRVHIVNFDLVFNPGYSVMKRPVSFCFNWFLWRRELKKRIRAFVKEHNIDITASLTYDIALPYHMGGCPHILESHCSKNETINLSLIPMTRLIQTRTATRQSDVVVALTSKDLKFWNKAKKAVCISNFTSVKQYTPYNSDVKSIVAAGRLEEQKGFDILIKAWHIINRRHPDWNLDIYGEGSLRTRLQHDIEKQNLESSVRLCGASDNIAKTFSHYSIFALSSRFEGFGLVLLEAMTCGVPCVSFDCPEGPSEIITDGRDGILVPFRELSDAQRAEALAENICRMIEDRDMRIRMSQEAIAKAATFSRDTIIDRWIELFNDLTKK